MTSAVAEDHATTVRLVERLRLGDLAALETLYARHGTALLRLAYRLTASREDAEDVVQDVFVGLRLALRQYEESGNFDGWLRRVTARRALTMLRHSRRRREDALPMDLVRSAPGSADPAERLTTRVTLEAAIAALPDALRIVFVLREIEDYPHADIARMLGIRRGTSEVRLHRAIQRLRQNLRDTW
jgi:RNA polymerase sigma-70 factor (ECF subfamily)